MTGVPSLLSGKASSVVSSVLAINADKITTRVTQSWGIFNSKSKQVLNSDSFVNVNFTNSTKVANYPVEQGGFESYNKVNNPSTVSVTLSKGGTAASREARSYL